MAKEIVRCGALDRVYMSIDYFDASINRILAWSIGFRSWQKALLFALLMPNDKLKALQDSGDFSALMALSEQIKTLPFSDIWEHYCKEENVVSDKDLFDEVKKYENEVLLKRG